MVNIYDVGDVAPLRLEVTPSGLDTVAAVTVYPPSGLERALAAAPSADRDLWETALELDEAGTWQTRWTVTGTGAGVEWHELIVRPDPAGPAGGAYATTAQLTRVLDEAPPPRARRLLERASRRVDDVIRCAVYDVDPAGQPTDPAVAAALAQATCEVVEWWVETGDDSGSGAATSLAGAQIGSVRLGAAAPAAPGGPPPGFAPAAWSTLQRAGLTSRGPNLYAHHGGRWRGAA